MMDTLLGIDYGKKRIGLAVSDGLGLTAQGLDGIERTGVPGEDIARLGVVVRERNVGAIVLGKPLRLDGTEGLAVAEVEKFALRLREELGLPVHMWDERLSTAQAERTLLEANVSRGKRKKARDRMAAQLVLQSFMDARSAVDEV